MLSTRYRIGLWGGLLLLMLFAPHDAQAQELSRSISVVPAKTLLTLNPGQEWTGELQIAVSVPTEVTVRPEAVDFRSQSEEGGVPYFFRPEVDQYVGILSRWVDLPATPLVLEPNVYTTIPVTIRIPRNAPAGGYYGAVLFRVDNSANPDRQLGSSIDSAIAALYVVDVSGDRTETGAIVDFYFKDDLNEGLPAEGLLRFENLGNTHIVPTGVIEIFNEFGFVVERIPLNEANGLVLPRDVRRFDFAWGESRDLISTPWFDLPLGKPLGIGYYRAQLTLWYGSTGQVVHATDRFVILPWRALILFGIVGYGLIRLLGYLWYRYKLEVILGRRLSFGDDKKRDTPRK